jgi:hypothetical protein
MAKISISLEEASWRHLVMDSGLWGETSKEIIKEVNKQLENKMSRSKPSMPPEPAHLSPLDFAGCEGKIFAISSGEREPIESILPLLKGNVVIFAKQGEENYPLYQKLSSDDRDTAVVRIRDIVHLTILIKRFKDAGIDYFILDRFDYLDNERSKEKKGAVRSGLINSLPTYIGKGNFFITTMMGDPGLFERVDKHIVV